MSENVEGSTSCNPKGLHSLYREDNFTLPYHVIEEGEEEMEEENVKKKKVNVHERRGKMVVVVVERRMQL
jgi:hypothetical protein